MSFIDIAKLKEINEKANKETKKFTKESLKVLVKGFFLIFILTSVSVVLSLLLGLGQSASTVIGILTGVTVSLTYTNPKITALRKEYDLEMENLDAELQGLMENENEKNFR